MITPAKLYLLLGAILVIVVAIVLAIFAKPVAPAGQGTTSFPTASSTNQSGSWFPGADSNTASAPPLVISGAGGVQVAVIDFLHNGTTEADVENPGTYYLAGNAGYCKGGICPQGATTTDFTITYDANAQVFTIALAREPLGTVREEAQTFLEAMLGVDQTSLCALRYYVGTTYWVNELYDNRNLGFSFCPGATALPQ